MSGLSQYLFQGCRGGRNGRWFGDRPDRRWPVGRGVHRAGIRSETTGSDRGRGDSSGDREPASGSHGRGRRDGCDATLDGADLSLEGSAGTITNSYKTWPERRWCRRV